MIPLITPLPSPPPSTDDPTNFDDRGDDLLGALPTMVDEQNAAIGAINDVAADIDATADAINATAAEAATAAAAAIATSAFGARSSSSLSLTAGTKSVHLDLSVGETPKIITDDDQWVAVRRSDPNSRMYFAISGWDGVNNFTATVVSSGIDVVGSTGPFTDWMLISAIFASPGAQAVDVLAGISRVASITPGGAYDALAEVSLTDVSTIAVDMSTFLNAIVILGGNRTLGNPSNPKVGQSGSIRVVQDATGSRTLAFGGNWRRVGGPPVLTTTASATDVLVYKVLTATFILYEIKRNP